MVNETLPGHSFEHGTVTRSLVINQDSISVLTVGVGVNTGPFAWAGNMASSLYFPAILDTNIRNDIFRQNHPGAYNQSILH